MIIEFFDFDLSSENALRLYKLSANPDAESWCLRHKLSTRVINEIIALSEDRQTLGKVGFKSPCSFLYQVIESGVDVSRDMKLLSEHPWAVMPVHLYKPEWIKCMDDSAFRWLQSLVSRRFKSSRYPDYYSAYINIARFSHSKVHLDKAAHLLYRRDVGTRRFSKAVENVVKTSQALFCEAMSA